MCLASLLSPSLLRPEFWRINGKVKPSSSFSSWKRKAPDPQLRPLPEKSPGAPHLTVLSTHPLLPAEPSTDPPAPQPCLYH